MSGNGLCQFQAWLLKISCAITLSCLFNLLDWVKLRVGGWVRCGFNKTSEDSGSTWWKMSAQEYGMQVEQSYSVKRKEVKSLSHV